MKIKKRINSHFVVPAIFLMACSTVEQPAEFEESGIEAVSEDNLEAREKLEKYIIDNKIESVRTQPEKMPIRSISQRLEAEKFVDAVREITGEKELIQGNDTRDTISGSTEHYTFSIDVVSGNHQINRRPEAVGTNRTRTFTTDQDVIDLAKSLYAPLNVNEEEAVVRLRTVYSSVMNRETGATEEPMESGKVLSIERSIGGIRVPENRITMFVNADGKLGHLRGKWTPVDYANSKLFATMGKNEIVTKALDSVMDQRFAGRSRNAFNVNTHYKLQPSADGGFVLRMVGAISFPKDESGNIVSERRFEIQ